MKNNASQFLLRTGRYDTISFMESALPIERIKPTASAAAPSKAVSAPANASLETDCDWNSVTRQMARGDTESLARYYESTFDLMLREISRTSGRDEHTCLDILHDALLKVIRCIKPLPDAGAVAAWSRTVAKSATYDWLRSDSRRRKLVGELPPAAQSNDGAAEGLLLDEARLVWLEEQLCELPRELQSMISRRYRLGWSLKRIGAWAGLKTGAVDGRLQRAIEQLKTKARVEFEE